MTKYSDTNIAKEKLMILYIIKKSNFTLSYNNLSNLILEYELMNYFEFIDYFTELKKTNFIANSNKREISLTNFAMQSLELFENNINIKKKNLIDEIFTNDSKNLNRSECQVVNLEDEKYIVQLSLNGDLDNHFNLSFTIDNLEEAYTIEKSWSNKNRSLYREIINIIRNA